MELETFVNRRNIFKYYITLLQVTPMILDTQIPLLSNLTKFPTRMCYQLLSGFALPDLDLSLRVVRTHTKKLVRGQAILI